MIGLTDSSARGEVDINRLVRRQVSLLFLAVVNLFQDLIALLITKEREAWFKIIMRLKKLITNVRGVV